MEFKNINSINQLLKFARPKNKILKRFGKSYSVSYFHHGEVALVKELEY